jgi:hypothetical protein
MRKKTMVVVAAVSSAIICVALAGFATLVSPVDAPCCGNTSTTNLAAKPQTPAPIVGEFTGEYANGLPIYRLPSVTVAAGRNSELAGSSKRSWRGWPRTARLSGPPAAQHAGQAVIEGQVARN